MNQDFQKYKSMKAQQRLKHELEIIVNAICVLYILSIHDIVDVYRHAITHDFATSEMINEQSDFHVLPSNVTSDLLAKNGSTEFHNDYLKVVNSRKMFSRDRQLLEKHDTIDFNRYEDSREIISTSNERILFFFREETQDFGDFLFVCFLFLVLIRLKFVDKLRRKILHQPKNISLSIREL